MADPIEWLKSINPDIFLGPNGVLRYFNSNDGETIASYYWPAHGEAKAVIQIVHGHGSYLCWEYLKVQGPGKPSSYAGSWIEHWNKAGFSVCGIDLHGLGRSTGLRGYTASFQHYVDEVLQFTSIVKNSDISGFAGLPVFLTGLSLGGNVATTSVIQAKDAYAGLVLLAPMLDMGKFSKRGVNKIMRPVVSWLAKVIPTAAALPTDKNTRFPYIQEVWDQDPATYHGRTRINNASCYLAATSWVMSHLEEVKLPFITFHSDNDTMTDPDASKALMARSPSADKQLRPVNHMWHFISKEEENEVVRDEVAAWIAARVK